MLVRVSRSCGTELLRVTGRDFDNLKPVIEEIGFLVEEDRRNIFECNCTRLNSRFKKDRTWPRSSWA